MIRFKDILKEIRITPNYPHLELRIAPNGNLYYMSDNNIFVIFFKDKYSDVYSAELISTWEITTFKKILDQKRIKYNIVPIKIKNYQSSDLVKIQIPSKFIKILSRKPIQEIKITPYIPQIELEGYSWALQYNLLGNLIYFHESQVIDKNKYYSDLLNDEELYAFEQILDDKRIKFDVKEDPNGNGPDGEFKYRIFIPKENVKIIK